MIVQFPPIKSRRIAARRPRRSKNGTPEERAAKRAGVQAKVIELPGGAAKRPMTWPEIAPFYLKDGSAFADDHPCTDAELAALHFDAMPKFRTDGTGAGTPEFREQLEEHLFNLKVSVKFALVILGYSKDELVDRTRGTAATATCEEDDASIILAKGIGWAHEELLRLAAMLRCAEVRQVSAIAACAEQEETLN
jgi:hypothetical protein